MNNFQKLMKNGNGLGTFTNKELLQEILKRDITKNPFPLDVFHDKIRPFINGLNTIEDIPASFIGLSLLSAYSTSIGTAYVVQTSNRNQVFLPIWGALVGMSSSGKSITLNHIFKALDCIQCEFDRRWEEKTQGMQASEINCLKLETVIYRDAHMPTLVKSVLPDNPKGVLKMCDELLEWTNGMNQVNNKEGTDEQVWTNSWSCTKYSGIRSGKQKFVIKRPFVNVIGGTQYSVLPRFYAKDRDTTGFVYRMLFALPEINKIAEPDLSREIPNEWYAFHSLVIERLYKDLPVDSAEDEPRKCILTPDAVLQYNVWTKAKIKSIGNIDDLDEKNFKAGILGKIKEYALRFSAILHLVDKALDSQYGHVSYSAFKNQEYISAEVLQRGLKLADYFYVSAFDVYTMVQESTTAPYPVLVAANLWKRGKTLAEIAEILYNSKENKYRMKVSRDIRGWIKKYPKVFQSSAK